MASNYNRRPLPAEVLVDGRHADRDSAAADARRSAGARDPEHACGSSDCVRGARSERQADAGRACCAASSSAGRECRLLLVSGLRDRHRAGDRQALHGEREYGADVMQLLYVANRYEQKPQMSGAGRRATWWFATVTSASSIAYGEAQGSTPVWLADIAAIPAGARADDSARHRAGNRRAAQGGRSRSLRARPRPALARARQLPPPGAAGRMAAARRRARQGRRRRRRDQGGRVTARAAVSARTSFAPAASNARARVQRRARRAHIVDQHHGPPSTAAAAPQRKRAAHVGVTPGGRKVRLRRRSARSLQHLHRAEPRCRDSSAPD